MSLFSTTLPTQPPPLHPRSPYDVSSFDILTKSLRQHPDLTNESDKILNSFQLAKFVDGVRRFQGDHLGVVSFMLLLLLFVLFLLLDLP
jgi:hypothetical protein